jgi:DNA mismatch repair protein MLH1
VNVHPTKHEVHFLHEDVIVDCIQKTIQESLLNCNSSRTYYTQSLLPSTSAKVSSKCLQEEEKADQEHVYDYKLVRMDAKEKKLDAFAVPKSLSPPQSNISAQRARKPVHLTSILSLQNDIKKNEHNGM